MRATLGEIADLLDRLEVRCTRCDRHGRYRIDRLITQHGADFSLLEFRRQLAATCDRAEAPIERDRCDILFPELVEARPGTGKWRAPGVPHAGWECTGVEDLEDGRETCEMCETREIRFVHTMAHPDYPDELRCGCICAGYMEQDLVGARKREKSARLRGARRSHWLGRRWLYEYGFSAASQARYVNTSDGFHAVVWLQRDGTWMGMVEHRESGYERPLRRSYPTLDETRLATFDLMIGLKAAAPWNPRR